MADAQIGSLLILLEANTAKLDEQIRQSKANLNGFKDSVESVKTAIIGLGAYEGLKEIIAITAENEKAQALLESQIKATGDASGLSAKQLLDLADSFQQTTTYSHAQVESLESQLMAFTNISGEVFKRAIATILDYSTVTGKDAASAVRTLGVALDDPAKGMDRLKKADVDLNETTKDTIKAMAEQGDVVGAQNLLLDELQKRYGGAAAAARDTLGGALQGLKHDFEDLLEGSGGGVKDVTEAVKDLDEALKDPDVKQGLATLVSGILELTGVLAKAAAGFGGLGTAIGEFFAKANGGRDLDDRLAELPTTIQAIKDKMVQAREEATNEGFLGRLLAPDMGKLQQQLDAAERELDLLQRLKDMASSSSPTNQLGPLKSISPEGPDISALPKIKGASEAIQSEYNKIIEQERQAGEIMDQNDPSRILARQIAATEALVGTVVNGEIFTEDQALQHIQALDDAAAASLAKSQQANSQMSQFGKEAARNIQDNLANFLFNPAQKGFDGMVAGFSQMLEKMIDQAIAADLLDHVFGTGQYGSGQSALSGGLANFFGSIFTGGSGNAMTAGGTSPGFGTDFGSGSGFGSNLNVGAGHAMGGPVSSGTLYPVGENGPELYADSSGNNFLLPGAAGGGDVIPNGGGGHTEVHIDARGAGPDEVARLLALSRALETSIISKTERRLQTGGWPAPMRRS